MKIKTLFITLFAMSVATISFAYTQQTEAVFANYPKAYVATYTLRNGLANVVDTRVQGDWADSELVQAASIVDGAIAGGKSTSTDGKGNFDVALWADDADQIHAARSERVAGPGSTFMRNY